jgi:hypothetical protein
MARCAAVKATANLSATVATTATEAGDFDTRESDTAKLPHKIPLLRLD